MCAIPLFNGKPLDRFMPMYFQVLLWTFYSPTNNQLSVHRFKTKAEATEYLKREGWESVYVAVPLAYYCLGRFSTSQAAFNPWEASPGLDIVTEYDMYTPLAKPE